MTTTATNRGKGRRTVVPPKSATERAPTRSRNRFPELDLIPGLRNRLLQEMDASEIPPKGRVAHLRSWTNCSASTARRWLDEEPGLPDLESFTKLCLRFKTDVNWMLGLSSRRMALPEEDEGGGDHERQTLEWASVVMRAVGDGLTPFVVVGDDMEPRIRAGDIVFFDPTIDRIAGNGTYLLRLEDRIVVRNVEDRVSQGLVLRCANPLYREIVVEPGVVASAKEFQVLGRVKRSLCMFSF